LGPSLHLIHISDTHLGFSDLDRFNSQGINFREQDNYEAFRDAVDLILEKKPDFLVHSGDFFHRPSPSNRALIEGIFQLKRISDAKIPTIIIAGNHSTPRTEFSSPILKAFSSLENVFPVFGKKYEVFEFEKVAIHGLPYMFDEDVFLECVFIHVN